MIQLLAQAELAEPVTLFFDNPTLDEWAIKIGGALLILILGIISTVVLVGILKSTLKKTKIDQTALSFVSNLVRAILIVLVIVVALLISGVPQAPMVAALGASGLAIALSLQGSLSNLAAGVLLSIFRPFKIGDVLDVGGEVGIVDELQILFTRMHTPDNRGLIVPNSQLLSNNILNLTSHDTRRVDFTFGIGYTDDMDRAKAILHEIIAEDPRILKDPEPLIGLAELGDNSVNFWVRPWVNRVDYLDVLLETKEKVKKRFDQEGISIPFPQRDVHLYYENKYPDN
ncbi:MAG: mechanosensitive ion channel domain-containing protein [Verrucomicrobiota bacterium]